jgi:multidrug efflux pump subunit AcrB
MSKPIDQQTTSTEPPTGSRQRSVLIDFALRNPYAVLALSIGLCLLSLTLLPSLPVDILPDFRRPVVISYFTYPGLPTIDMEKSVTERVERVLPLAGGLEHMESRSMPGVSVIKSFFYPGVNPSSALNDIVNQEANDMHHLPPGIDWPFTMRSEPANLPVILAAIGGEGLDENELYRIGYYAVRNKMGGLPGMQVPHPFGGKYRQMMIYLDPAKLRSVGLSLTDVAAALKRANIVMGSGTAKLGSFDYQIHCVNTLPEPADIDEVPIAVRDGKPIFIRDVGYAKDDASIQYNIVHVDGKRSVYCPIMREPGVNTIAVVDQAYKMVREDVPKMKDRGEIPEEAKITLVADQSSYIRAAMRNLLYEVGLGAILVAVVVALFLRRLLPTLAIVAVIALSLLIGGLGFAFTGNSINVMTLGGVALAVGTVVNVGIVIVENVIRHLQMGKSPMNAAREGSTEVAMPVLAGTVTTLAVFIPAIFLTGMIRDLFAPLSAAATLTIGASYFIGMTVVPAFCVRFIRARSQGCDSPETAAEGAARGPASPQRSTSYGWLLSLAIRARWAVIAVVVGLVGASLLLLPGIGTQLFPEVDAGTFEIRMRTVPGTRIEQTERVVRQVEETIREIIPASEIETLIANIGLPAGKGAGYSAVLSPNTGPDSAYLIVNLKKQGRSTSTQTYMERLRPLLRQRFPQEKFLFVSGGMVNLALNEGVPVPIDIQVSAGSSLKKAREKAEEIARAVRKVPGTADVQIAQAVDYPQLDVHVDRTRAKYLGLDQEDVAQTVLSALASSIGYAPIIWVDPATGVDHWMGVQYETNEVASLEEIGNIPLSLNTQDGPITVPLSNVATVRRVSIPGEVAHNDIARVYDVYANVSGRDVGSVAADVERVLAELPEEPGVTYTVRGPVQAMRSGIRLLGLGIVVAAVLVYLVMMAQFRSFLDPLIIVLAVPLGFSGVLVMLYFTGTRIDIQSLIGAMMMIGVVVNNSILLVEFANQLCERGYDPKQAALAAAQIRLRPILMTTLALVASMLPLSFHFAPGGEAMIPLARAFIGGVLVSTVLTLFLVPCVYTLVKRAAPSRPIPATA